MTQLTDQNSELQESEEHQKATIKDLTKTSESLKQKVKELEERVEENNAAFNKQLIDLEESSAEKQDQLYTKLDAKADELADALESHAKLMGEHTQALTQCKQLSDNLRLTEEQIDPLQQENDAYQQRFSQQEQLVGGLKQDFQQILNYKSDLEVLVEEQT